jgi:hypothetical protein
MTRLHTTATTLLLAVGLAACGCGGGHAAAVPAGPATPLANGSAAPPPAAVAPTTCDGITAKLDQLFRADAQVAEPKRVDERTRDNVHMVMTECAKHPATVVACVNNAATLKDIESQCLAPIDDEGTEGVAGGAGSGK